VSAAACCTEDDLFVKYNTVRMHNFLLSIFIYPGHSGSPLIRSFLSPVLLVLDAFFPNLVFRNFPGNSNLTHCIKVSNSKLGQPCLRVFDEMFGVLVEPLM